jgi:excisionase family DNA binding protein
MSMDNRPFTPDMLAERWQVSANTVRAEIERGALSAFRIGKLYRIKSEAVEEYECRNTRLVSSGEALPSHGTTEDGADVFSLRHAREKRRRPKPSTSSGERPPHEGD